jgi:membrane protein DedA with SNARE-associated domain
MQHFLLVHGYLAVFVLMLASSACIPVPSEVVLVLGGALASDAVAAELGGKPLGLVTTILVAIAGSLLGTFIAYVVGRTAGRTVVDRWGKVILISHADLDRSERWFNTKGEWVVLVGNVIPFVRAFISFPAGVAEMQPVRFGIFSAIGISAWCTALVLLGHSLGAEYPKYNKTFNWAGYVVAVVVVAAIAFSWIHRYQGMKKHDQAGRGKHAAR